MPVLDRLFSLNGRVHFVVHFVPDKALDVVLCGEAACRSGLVLPDAAGEVCCGSDIESSSWLAGHDVDARYACLGHGGIVSRGRVSYGPVGHGVDSGLRRNDGDWRYKVGRRNAILDSSTLVRSARNDMTLTLTLSLGERGWPPGGRHWIPAFAGMTVGVARSPFGNPLRQAQGGTG